MVDLPARFPLGKEAAGAISALFGVGRLLILGFCVFILFPAAGWRFEERNLSIATLKWKVLEPADPMGSISV
jgi:hypothetical protein